MIKDIAFIFECGNQLIQLPVNPGRIEVGYSSTNKIEEVVKLGEINILRNKKLSVIKFESFFPYDTWFPAVRTSGRFEGPKFYIDLFKNLMESGKECRFTVTGLNISELVSVEKFEYYHQAGDHEDVYYSLELQEYKPYGISYEAKSIVLTGEKILTVTPKRVETQVSIGSTVILNGTVHLDSYGSKPGKTFNNYQGKVNLINIKGSHPYHVTTMEGGWLGWVLESAVTPI